jgi:hypothetical protein
MPYNQTIVIDGTITLLAPFSASQPDGDDNFNKFPLMPRGIGADGKPSWTGYIPAGAMRGEYFCVTEDAHFFQAQIAEFALVMPRTLH